MGKEALSFAAGLASGYMNTSMKLQDREREKKREDEDDAARREEREFRREERERARSMRRDVAEAAAPATVDANMTHGPEMDDRDVGTPGAVLKQDGYRVGQARMADRGEAEKTAAAANSGKARTARMSAALEKHGEHGQAASLRSSARQEEAGEMQLDEIKRKRLDEAYDRDLSRARTHDALAQFVSESKGDGSGGEIQTKAVPSPDGKTVTYHQVNPDGTLTKTPYTFSNDFNGVAQAAFMLSKGVGSKDKLDHLIGTAKTTEERSRWEKEFGLREKGEERRAKHDQAMLANDTARVGIARMAAGAKGPTAATPDGTFDAKTAADIAKDQVQKEADDARTAGKAWTGAQIAKRTDEIVQSLRQSHTARFVEEAVTRQLGAAQADPAKYAATYQQAVQLGMPPQRLAAMGFKPPGGAMTPAPQAAPAQMRQPPPIGPGTPAGAPQAPAAQAPKPGVEGFADMVAQNITSPNGKAAIAQHVRTRLPAIQAEIQSHAQVMALPLVSGPVKAQLKAKVDALAQEAEMMQTFIDGNAGT